MRLLSIFIFLLLISCSGQNNHSELASLSISKEKKEYKEYYDHVSINGDGKNRLKTTGQVDKNGFSVGEWKHYLENGVLEYITNFSSNVSKKYYATGELKEIGKFNSDSGAHIGEWITYYKNGTIKTLGVNNDDGEKNGVYKTYFENGSLESATNYKNGIIQL